jgi:DNA polymerase
LVGEKDGLQRIRNKEDLYKLLAAEIYGIPVSQVTKEQRQLGKQCVLGCGYGIGALTFQATCLKYGMHIPIDVCQRAVEVYRATFGTVKTYWYQLEDAIREAIMGNPQRLGPLRIAANEELLAIQLPSGRKLRYQKPSLRNDKVHFWAEDSKTHQWTQETAWGGKFFGHVVQGTANCIQREAALRLKKANFDLVYHAYDELVAEDQPERLDEFTRIMSLSDNMPAWMAGMFITVDSNATRTYRK